MYNVDLMLHSNLRLIENKSLNSLNAFSTDAVEQFSVKTVKVLKRQN